MIRGSERMMSLSMGSRRIGHAGSWNGQKPEKVDHGKEAL